MFGIRHSVLEMLRYTLESSQIFGPDNLLQCQGFQSSLRRFSLCSAKVTIHYKITMKTFDLPSPRPFSVMNRVSWMGECDRASANFCFGCWFQLSRSANLENLWILEILEFGKFNPERFCPLLDLQQECRKTIQCTKLIAEAVSRFQKVEVAQKKWSKRNGGKPFIRQAPISQFLWTSHWLATIGLCIDSAHFWFCVGGSCQ